MHHCRPHGDSDDEYDGGNPQSAARERRKTPRGLDISIKFYDNFVRTMDTVKKSLDAIKEREHEMDAAVNFGVGYIEDKKLTHGISMAGLTTGIYGGKDLIYNANTEEYLLLMRSGEIMKLDWAGAKTGSVVPSRKFSRFVHIPQTGHYMCYNPGRKTFFVFREDWTMALDTICIMPIDLLIYGGRKTDDNSFDFFITSGVTVNKYSYTPTGNALILQDSIKMADIEADGSEMEQICFDQPMDDKKQWIYVTFRQHVSIIDVQGRAHGTKRNLHPHRITAIVAYGPSEFVVTGDEKGLLKMWGARWTPITEIHPHVAMVSHLIEHPNGRAVVSFSPDQIIFAWSLDSGLKLESMKSPEIVERLATNPGRKSFMTCGPRKLVLWKMDVLFTLLTPLSAPVGHMGLTWDPEYPPRVILYTLDNAVRALNPVTGRILKSALINPPKSPLTDVLYIPSYETIYVLKSSQEEVNSLEIQVYDGTQNPCRLRETWNETKWDADVTAMALYDLHPSIVVEEKGIAYVNKKQAVITPGPTTFIIAGMRDGCVARLDIQTGEIDYKAPCHKGQIIRIEVNPELNQFATMGTEPSLRLWKVNLAQLEMFVPLFDITWKYAIRHVAIVREVISFALSHHDSTTHKVVFFNTSETERYDHRAYFMHKKEIISLSACRDLMLFCSASKDETIRIWNDKAELIRILALNWNPVHAAFGTKQGDIFVGMDKSVFVIPANKYLSVIYRNRVLMSGLTAGPQERPIPLNTARSGQDPRMYIVLEEEDKFERDKKERQKAEAEKNKMRLPGDIPGGRKKGKDEEDLYDEKIPFVAPFDEPKDSQRAKDYEKYRLMEEDLKQIVEGNHQFSIYVPDFRKMTKKQLDEYGKTIFPDDGDKRKMFASESRVACLVDMQKHAKELDHYDDPLI